MGASTWEMLILLGLTLLVRRNHPITKFQAVCGIPWAGWPGCTVIYHVLDCIVRLVRHPAWPCLFPIVTGLGKLLNLSDFLHL